MVISALAPHDGCMAASERLPAPPYEAQDMIGSYAEDATTQASSWSSPNTLGLPYRAPSAGSPCGDVLAHDRDAIDMLLDRVAAGSPRTCVDVLDPAAR
jgi:hypothetical protein